MIGRFIRQYRAWAAVLGLMVVSGTAAAAAQERAVAETAVSNVQAAVVGDTLTVTFAAPTTGGTPPYYVLEFAVSQGGSAILVATTPTTTFTTRIPAGTPAGTYWVRVYAQFAMPGPASPDVPFTVAAAGPCAPAPPPGNLSQSMSGLILTLTWTASAGATGYVIEVGSMPGQSNILIAPIAAPTTSVTASLSAGFQAYVRVKAVNPCGQSTASNEIFVSATGAPPGPAPGVYDGTWTGFTDQGLAVSFVISGNRLIACEWNGRLVGKNGCTVTYNEKRANASVPVGPNGFVVSTTGSPGFMTSLIAADFVSTTLMQGRISFSQVPLPGFPPCEGLVETIFNARK